METSGHLGALVALKPEERTPGARSINSRGISTLSGLCQVSTLYVIEHFTLNRNLSEGFVHGTI